MDPTSAMRRVWASASQAPARASVDTSLIRERFNFDWATSDPIDDLDTYWWWARSIRVDPNEVIADDGEGNIWSVPFTTDGTDAITFGTPIRVAETYVPVAAGEGVAATAVVQRRRQQVVASDLERPTKPDPTNPAAEAADTEEAASMTDEQRRALALSLGLPEDADEATIHTTAAEQAVETRAEDEHVPGSETETPTETPAAETPAEPVAASVSVRATLGLPESATDAQVAAAAEELRAGAQAGQEARRAQLASELDAEVDAAVSDGRIAPSARDAWRQAIDPGDRPDAAATARSTAERERLGALASNRVPVRERGASPSAQAKGDNDSLRRAMAASGFHTDGRARAKDEVIRRG